MKNKLFVLVGLLFMFHEICHCQKKFSKLNLKANMSKESMTGLHQNSFMQLGQKHNLKTH